MGQYGKKKRIYLYITLFLLVLMALFAWDAENAYPPENGPHTDSEGVDYRHRSYFFPAEGSTGLVLYPGARVDARAYFPLARALSEKGIATYVVDFPLNYAFFSPGAYSTIVESEGEKTRWILAGHSLGGAMMASHVAKGVEREPDGLVFLSSYPTDGSTLETYEGFLLFVSPKNDGLVSLEEIKERARVLVPRATFVEIEGGNHAGFAAYGPQKGDGQMTIEKEEQIQQTVGALFEVIQ